MRDPEPGTAGEPVNGLWEEPAWRFWPRAMRSTFSNRTPAAEAAERWLATQPRYFHRRGPAERRPVIAAVLLAFAALDRLPR